MLSDFGVAMYADCSIRVRSTNEYGRLNQNDQDIRIEGIEIVNSYRRLKVMLP